MALRSPRPVGLEPPAVLLQNQGDRALLTAIGAGGDDGQHHPPLVHGPPEFETTVRIDRNGLVVDPDLGAGKRLPVDQYLAGNAERELLSRGSRWRSSNRVVQNPTPVSIATTIAISIAGRMSPDQAGMRDRNAVFRVRPIPEFHLVTVPRMLHL